MAKDSVTRIQITVSRPLRRDIEAYRADKRIVTTAEAVRRMVVEAIERHREARRG